MHRVRFFDNWHVWTNGAGVVFGSATIVNVIGKFGEEWLTVLFGVIVTIFFTADLLVGTANRARLHNDLARKFLDLEAKMELADVRDKTNLRKFRADKLLIDKDEPPTLKVLIDICENEMITNMGYKKKLIPINLFKRMLANFISFGAGIEEATPEKDELNSQPQ